MESPESLNDEEFGRNGKFVSCMERRYGHYALLHIREAERRRYYAKLGYGDILEYCVKELLYSEAAAGRRIRASRLLKDIPEIASKVEAGSLNISNLSQVQSFIRQEEKRTGSKVSVEVKREILQKIESKSQNQAQRILVDTFPEVTVVHSRERELPNGQAALTMIMCDRFRKKMARIKEITSHQNDNPSWEELFEKLADEYLKRHDPEQKVSRQSQLRKTSTQRLAAAITKKPTHRKPHRVSVKVEVFKKAHSQCQWVDPVTGRRCERRYHLQIDHIIPLARGGSNSPENLQLLCRAHNLLKGCRSTTFLHE